MVYNTLNYWVFGLCPSSGILETRKHNVRFEIFTAVTMKNAVFWDMARTDVSEERIASIFRVEKTASEEPA
jgi:hypothetical protein